CCTARPPSQQPNGTCKSTPAVEQNANHALKLSQRAYVMVNGRIQLSGDSAALLDNQEVSKAYLGLH
ncbi:hypothetical protein AB9F38_34915, partial [Rhizobium leguminosarum]